MNKITYSDAYKRKKKDKNKMRDERNNSEYEKYFYVKKYKSKKKNNIGDIVFKKPIYHVMIDERATYNTNIKKGERFQ
ncbi:MAG: hypothetical protein PHN60_03595 [Candidatus Gracilibacteria bacterium]|nr:hypothetical protein [Candidatus Gracilibacteria bacterium]